MPIVCMQVQVRTPRFGKKNADRRLIAECRMPEWRNAECGMRNARRVVDALSEIRNPKSEIGNPKSGQGGQLGFFYPGLTPFL